MYILYKVPLTHGAAAILLSHKQTNIPARMSLVILSLTIINSLAFMDHIIFTSSSKHHTWLLSSKMNGKLIQNDFEFQYVHKMFRRDNKSISIWLSLNTLDLWCGLSDETGKSLECPPPNSKECQKI